MINSALTYEMYLEKATDDEKKIINDIYINSQLSKEIIEKIKAIKKTVNLLVFAEPYCKDCAVALSFLEKMNKLNNNINISILSRKENESILSKYNKNQRIPTIVNLENKDNNVFSEFPKVIQEKIKNDEKNRSSIISDFRSGKYNKFVEEEILKIML